MLSCELPIAALPSSHPENPVILSSIYSLDRINKMDRIKTSHAIAGLPKICVSLRNL